MDGHFGKTRDCFAPLDFPALGPADTGIGLFDTVFEESDAGLLILDIDIGRLIARISDANSTICSWLSCGRSHLSGRNFMALVHQDMVAGDRHLLQHSLIRHKPVSLSLQISHEKVPPITCQAVIRPVKTMGNMPRMLVVLRRNDMSLCQELAMVSRERDAAMRMRERMLARVSHDLRTPLNGILGVADMMAHILDMQGEKVRDYARDIAKAGRELLWRVEDLLSAAQSLAPEMPRQAKDVEVARLLLRRVEYAQKQYSNAGIAIKLCVEPGLPLLHADEGDLIQILDTVIDNAVRASSAGDEVVLSCLIDTCGRMHLLCEDKGPAVRMEEIDAAVASSEEDDDVFCSPHIRSVAGLPMAKALAMRNNGFMKVAAGRGGQGFSCGFFFPADLLVFRT